MSNTEFWKRFEGERGLELVGSEPLPSHKPIQPKPSTEEPPQPTPILISHSEELEAIDPCGDTLAIDLETTGLNPRESRIRLVSLADEAGRVWLVDTFHVDVSNIFPLLEGRTLVAHNAAFDLGFLWQAGFTPSCPVVDTMILSRVLYAGESDVAPLKKKQTSHALEAVAKREMGTILDKSEQTADWSKPLSLSMLTYAAEDARILHRLLKPLESQIEVASLSDTAALEARVLPAILWLRASGVPIDERAWRTEAQSNKQKAEAALSRLKQVANINWNSWQQIMRAFSDIGIELPDTKVETLAGVDHPLAKDLLEYRSFGKLASTYGEGWLEHVSEGRVYADWVQVGPATGRMACRNPNLQNIPRGSDLRGCFKAPPGRKLVIADYSQIEPRLAGKVAGDKAMLSAYAAGEDLHTKTAKSITGKREITKADRTAAKAVGFGLLYGMGAKGLRAYARGSYGVEMTLEEATQYRNRFFEAYPDLARWHEEVTCLNAGEARTLLGRRRGSLRSFREALNHPIQGTAADGQKLALALLWERRNECPHAFPILVVHDEIVIECDEDKVEEAREWLMSAMVDGMNAVVNASEPPVPIEIEAAISDSWIK
jgi:DNA polymerase I